jgi:hypothetical protein
MVVLTFAVASRYQNCCIDGGTIPEYFGFRLVMVKVNVTPNATTRKVAESIPDGVTEIFH